MNGEKRVPSYDDGSHYDDPTLIYGPAETPHKKMAETKTSYPVNEVLGFSAGVKQMLANYKAQMITAKVDPSDIIAKLGPNTDALALENGKQETLKTQLRDQTKLVEGLNTTAYADASQGCDLVIAAFGKRSEQAAEATRLRKGVRPVSRNNGNPPAPTTATK
jgi:hypothetical protein